ncbi:MAG: hypothetical protein ABSE86_09520 [Bryobacteraceae bacterium]|jgi:hypothetical protein
MLKSIIKTTGLIAAGLAVAWLGFLSFVYMKMKAPPEQFGAFMSKLPRPFYFVLPFEPLWFRARAGTVNVGDMAPDFALSTLDKSRVVRLSSFRGSKPVVLVFGSYT